MLPCPYVHIGIGNIFNSSLKEISENGFRVKYFREYSEKCLAGEDTEFIKKYMAKDGTTIFNPLKISELFKMRNLIDEKYLASNSRKINLEFKVYINYWSNSGIGKKYF